MKMKFRAFVAAIGLSVACGAVDAKAPLHPNQPIYAAPTLSDLKSVDELKTLFNQDRGKPRLVLLLSPT